MTDNQELNKQPKKGHFFIVFWLFLVACVFIGTKYFFDEKEYNFFKKSASNQFNNIDSKIYNKENDVAQQEIKPADSKVDSEQLVSVNDEYSSKDLYASIVRQQLQIDILQGQYLSLKSELEKVRNQDKLSKIIISFIELKDCIDAYKDCSQKLDKMILLTKSDPNMNERIADLKEALKVNPKSKDELKKEFRSLIPDIIAAKSGAIASQNLFDKIKNSLAKLIIIRRIDGVVANSSQNIDFVIVETEKLIDEGKYQGALNLLSNQEEKYKVVLEAMITDLQNANYLDKSLADIFDYLKSANFS